MIGRKRAMVRNILTWVPGGGDGGCGRPSLFARRLRTGAYVSRPLSRLVSSVLQEKSERTVLTVRQWSCLGTWDSDDATDWNNVMESQNIGRQDCVRLTIRLQRAWPVGRRIASSTESISNPSFQPQRLRSAACDHLRVSNHQRAIASREILTLFQVLRKESRQKVPMAVPSPPAGKCRSATQR